MYYLGQTIIVDTSDDIDVAIYAGYSEKQDTHWAIRFVKPEETSKKEWDIFQVKLEDVLPINTTEIKDKELKATGLKSVLYKGRLCTNKLSGELGLEFIDKNLKDLDLEYKYVRRKRKDYFEPKK